MVLPAWRKSEEAAAWLEGHGALCTPYTIGVDLLLIREGAVIRRAPSVCSARAAQSLGTT